MNRELDKRFDYIINHVDTKSLLLEAQPVDTSLDRLKEYLDRIYDFYEVSTKRCRFISGGISGAISDPLSNKALRHAEVYYEEIRHRTDDIKKISEFTGYTIEQILRVKNYLFIETHVLNDGIHQFDPSFEIAQSWQRLADMQKEVQPHDLLLIPHELMEMELISVGFNQFKAHEETSMVYNYPKEAARFYATLKEKEEANGIH